MENWKAPVKMEVNSQWQVKQEFWNCKLNGTGY